MSASGPWPGSTFEDDEPELPVCVVIGPPSGSVWVPKPLPELLEHALVEPPRTAAIPPTICKTSTLRFIDGSLEGGEQGALLDRICTK